MVLQALLELALLEPVWGVHAATNGWVDGKSETMWTEPKREREREHVPGDSHFGDLGDVPPLVVEEDHVLEVDAVLRGKHLEVALLRPGLKDAAGVEARRDVEAVADVQEVHTSVGPVRLMTPGRIANERSLPLF